MSKRFVVTKDGKPYRAYDSVGIAMLVYELCQDISPSHVWDIRPEGYTS